VIRSFVGALALLAALGSTAFGQTEGTVTVNYLNGANKVEEQVAFKATLKAMEPVAGKTGKVEAYELKFELTDGTKVMTTLTAPYKTIVRAPTGGKYHIDPTQPKYMKVGNEYGLTLDIPKKGEPRVTGIYPTQLYKK
jgi:hypothetical protein